MTPPGAADERARIVLAPSALGFSTEQLDTRYARLAGVAGGYLPKDRAAVDEWHEHLRGELRAAAATTDRSPAVTKLAELVETDGIVRTYVTSRKGSGTGLPDGTFTKTILANLP
jgi:hypothetical protein